MVRLRRTRPGEPGIRRIRAGRGFRYADPDGARPDAELVARIEELAIPPAWTDVWICAYPNGHIQATGTDAAGRKQYLYHPTWREQRDRLKFDRALALAESLPAARRGVTIDLRRDGLPRERVLAAAFRMLDTGHLRVGSERYALEHGSVGLSTLHGAHVSVEGKETRATRASPARAGRSGSRTCGIRTWPPSWRCSSAAARARACWRGGTTRGCIRSTPSTSTTTSAHGRAATSPRRTSAPCTAPRRPRWSLARIGPKSSASGQDRAIASAVRTTAELLGNTPAVARGSYIDPRLLDLYRDGVTIDPARTGSVESELRALLFD